MQLILMNSFCGIALQVVIQNSQDIIIASGFYHFLIQFLSDKWGNSEHIKIILQLLFEMPCHFMTERFNVT
jgi:hypothetical protein